MIEKDDSDYSVEWVYVLYSMVNETYREFTEKRLVNAFTTLEENE